MKKLRNIFFLTVALIFGSMFQSCSSDDSDAGVSDTYIRFTIAGTDYDFKDIITAESLSITLNGNNGEGITNVGDTQISLFLPLDIVVGNHTIEGGALDGDYKISFTSESLGFDFDFAESGTINVAAVTADYIEGTFTATITSADDETITLSNGTFRAMTI
ncbi:hypothetical protein [Flagellimonas onchidii]|uniref:hypothetical protein n=1 Tax=Flagellimonas onchidii TaxID=2562684 RepID=UPI0010A5FC82|nr:hypothetical protein [Allomuricauda onchidii]